jgi:hypothetical protein
MIHIAGVGVIIGVAVNIPLILYIFWSWRLLKRAYDGGRGLQQPLRRIEVWMRVVLWALVVSILWPFWAIASEVLVYFLGYSENGRERAFTEFVIGLAYLPVTISSWTDYLLLDMSVSPENGLVRWALLAGFLGVLLLAISLIEWAWFSRAAAGK